MEDVDKRQQVVLSLEPGEELSYVHNYTINPGKSYELRNDCSYDILWVVEGGGSLKYAGTITSLKCGQTVHIPGRQEYSLHSNSVSAMVVELYGVNVPLAREDDVEGE